MKICFFCKQVRKGFGPKRAGRNSAENRFGIFEFATIISRVVATENPCVGGSIPPLATTFFSCT